MKRISSHFTPFGKYIVPVVFPPMMAAVLWKLAAPPAVAVIAGAGLAALLIRRAWQLADAVYDAGENLILRRHGTEIAIPYTQVQAVHENLLRRPQTVTVEFKQPQPINPLVFVPAFDPSLIFGSSQVARDLRWRAGLEKYR